MTFKTILTFVSTLFTLTTAAQTITNKHEWRLVEVSSENVLTGELATMAFDGNPETQWHSRWHDARDLSPAEPPHSITLNLTTSQVIGAVRIRTRAHGEGGLPKKYQIELGQDGNTWETAAAGEIEYRSRMSPHAVLDWPKPIRARYLRLTVHSTIFSDRAHDPGLVIAEIDLSAKASQFTSTTSIPIPQSREWNYGGYHWKQRHRDLIEYSKRHPANLVFLGDSITHRWGSPPYDETQRTGQAVWNHYYGHRLALNLGYGWDRIENMIWRVEHGELDAVQPKLIVVMAGTNNLEVNTPKEIASGIRHLCIAIHQRQSKSRILLLAVFPRGKNAYPEALVELNKEIKVLDALDFITFRDIGNVFLDQEGQLTRDIMPDLLHPGEEGYRRWAAAIESDVSNWLEDRPVRPQ